jgi:hypothetical protein
MKAFVSGNVDVIETYSLISPRLMLVLSLALTVFLIPPAAVISTT